MSRQANVLLLLALAGGVAYGRFGLPCFLASGSDEIGLEEQSIEPVLVAQAEIPAGTFLGKDRPEKLFSLQYTTHRGTPASAIHSMDQARMKIVRVLWLRAIFCRRKIWLTLQHCAVGLLLDLGMSRYCLPQTPDVWCRQVCRSM